MGRAGWLLLWACAQSANGCRQPRSSSSVSQPAKSSLRSARARAVQALPADEHARLSYAVRIDDPLSRIEVEVCPTGFAIERLVAPSPGAWELLGGDPIITPEGNFRCTTDELQLPRTKPGECLRYSVTLPDKSRDPTGFRRVGRDLLASPDLWLWVAAPRPSNVPMRVRFTLPSGVVAALPWPTVNEGFALSETAFAWKAGGAFAHAAPAVLSVPGGTIAWSALGTGFQHAAEVSAWLTEGARAASSLFGHFPVPSATVIGVPGEGRRTSFGMALRGGGPAVVIFLDRQIDAQALASDWTSTHEFLHLGVPRLPPEDAWLFEGLATYYTEVVRARAGLITPAQAYQHLLNGFERGRANGNLRTLRLASAEMREDHAFYRVYWSGAALAFMTDLAARRAGGPTLDSALRAFADCCATSEKDWDAERVLAELDASLGTPRFSQLAKAWLDRAEFPDVRGALRELGVSPGPHEAALFQAAPSAAIRDAIMAPPTADSDAHSNREVHQSQ